MMDKEVNLLKIIISFIIFLTLLVGIPLAVFLVQQRQNIRQQAATEPDLVVESLQLTDAGGNVKSVFNKNEDIYVQITLKNQGGEDRAQAEVAFFAEKLFCLAGFCRFGDCWSIGFLCCSFGFF